MLELKKKNLETEGKSWTLVTVTNDSRLDALMHSLRSQMKVHNKNVTELRTLIFQEMLSW